MEMYKLRFIEIVRLICINSKLLPDYKQSEE